MCHLCTKQFEPLFNLRPFLTCQVHAVQARERELDNSDTKGFYQWSSMAFVELHTSQWDIVTNTQNTNANANANPNANANANANPNLFAHYAIDLAYWIIDVHNILQRTRNTGYAFEGIVHAYEAARQTGDTKAMAKFASTVDTGLWKLTSWQVSGPNQNPYLTRATQIAEVAVGGVLNHRKEPTIRIDVTQHQMHAVVLALKYLYP